MSEGPTRANASAKPVGKLFPQCRWLNAVRIPARAHIAVVGGYSQGIECRGPNGLQSQQLSIQINQGERGGSACQVSKPLGLGLAQDRLLAGLNFALPIGHRGNGQANHAGTSRRSGDDQCKGSRTSNHVHEGEKAIDSPVETSVQSVVGDPVVNIKCRLSVIALNLLRCLMLLRRHYESHSVSPAAAALGCEPVALGSFSVRCSWPAPCEWFDGVRTNILSQVGLAAHTSGGTHA